MTPIDRRAFVLAAFAMTMTRRLALGDPTLRVGVLSTGRDARERHSGALLGIEEAQHAAALFGGRAELISVDGIHDRTPSLAAILGNDSLATSLALAKAATPDRLFMNVACPSDELRGAGCSPFTFHVAPSEAMLRDARAQAAGATDVVAWDGSLVRFGADTLNDRFRKRFGTSMTSSAWACWFAVKALWESSLRMKTADPRQLAEYLTRETTQFDGHKGRPLSFRAWDHQLRQLVYARVGAKVIDVPQSASPETTSRDFLDRLGAGSAASACRLVR